MKILKNGEDEYRLTLTPAEGRIFINCMNETIRELGSEFATRMGAEVDEIKGVIASLEAALKT